MSVFLVVVMLVGAGYVLSAPYTRHAQVAGVLVSPEGRVPAGAPLQVHLFVPYGAVRFVHQNQPVQLRYRAYPYQKFGHQLGHVMAVASSPLPAGREAHAEPLYRVEVNLESQVIVVDQQTKPLTAGTRVDVTLPLERRRLMDGLVGWVTGVAS